MKKPRTSEEERENTLSHIALPQEFDHTLSLALKINNGCFNLNMLPQISKIIKVDRK